MVNHNNGDRTTDVDARLLQKEEENLRFHDFLGSKTETLASASMTQTRLPSEKTALAALTPSTASASSGGGHGGLSSTSDLGSVERQGRSSNHLDGLHLLGSRNEVSGSTISNRVSGSKRSSLDSHFTNQDSLETLHWGKLLRNGPGSLTTNANPLANNSFRGGQVGQLLHQLSSSRFKDENQGSSLISQTAADEGSRTGMKGPGILSSFSVPNPSKIEHFASSNTGNRKDLTSNTRQMTIFYGGQAHVFDDVHPNKADVIMALAGSNGGSWSTGFSNQPTGKNSTNDDPYTRGHMFHGGSSREKPVLAPEFRARLGHQTTSSTCHRIFTQPGVEQQGSIIQRRREPRDPVHLSDPGNEAT